MDVLEDETLENKNYETLDNMFSKMLVDNCVSPGGNFENYLSSLNFTDYAKQCWRNIEIIKLSKIVLFLKKTVFHFTTRLCGNSAIYDQTPLE